MFGILWSLRVDLYVTDVVLDSNWYSQWDVEYMRACIHIQVIAIHNVTSA